MMLRTAAVMAGLALGLMSATAKADRIVTFHASGLFDNGASLGGTYVVNTTTGTPISVDLTFGSPLSSDVTILDGNDIFNGQFLQYTLNNVNGPNIYPGFSFLIDAPSLVGYMGGSLSTSSTLYLDSNGASSFTTLVSGTLSSVPLPASAPMFGAGLIALGAAGYAAKRKKASTV